MNHHGTGSANSGSDAVFGYSIVMVTTHSTVLNPLAFGEKFGIEFLGSVDAIISAVVTDSNSNTDCFSLKMKFGLDSFRPVRPT